MALDFITVMPIIAAIFLRRSYIPFVLLIPVLIIRGAFPVLPAGLEEALLLCAVAFSIYLKKIFNTNSIINLAVIVSVTLFSYGVLFSFVWSITSGELSRDVLLRGGAFIIREHAVTFLLLVFMTCCVYSFKLIRYAFVEEKII